MAGVAREAAGDPVPAAGRHRAGAGQWRARSGQAAGRSAVPDRVAGSGSDPVRRQPHFALPRVAGHRPRGTRTGQLRRGDRAVATGAGGALRGWAELVDRLAVRCAGVRDRADGDCTDAAHAAAKCAHRQHVALGRHRDRSARRAVRGADLRGDRVAPRRPHHRHLHRHDRLRHGDRCAECVADRIPAAPTNDSRIPAELRGAGGGAVCLQCLQRDHP